MPRKAKDHGGISSDAWCSPRDVNHALLQMYGRPIGTDPCTNERSVIEAQRKLTYGGLVLPWGGVAGVHDDAYSNWPYSQNDVWAPKAIAELETNLDELVVLCMTATSTRWWRSLMREPRRNPRVLCTKRIPFLGPDGEPGDSSRFEPALIYYGSKVRTFDREFDHITMWSTWGR